MNKDKEADILLWISGGFLIVVGTIATVMAATAPTNTPVANATAPPDHTAVIVQTPATASTTPTPPAVRPALPPGQVWECVVNGQRTFSDVRCGDRATIRQLSEMNRMEPTPVLPAAVFRPDSAGYALPPPEPNASDFPNDIYASEQVIVINERARREHMSRLHHHHGRAPKH